MEQRDEEEQKPLKHEEDIKDIRGQYKIIIIIILL